MIAAQQRADAATAAVEIANRLRDTVQIERAVAVASKQSRYFLWSSYGFGSGNAGLSLLWAHLDRCCPNAGWDKQFHISLDLATKAAETHGLATPSLFSGLAGLAFAAQYASNGSPRYRRLLTTLDTHICALLRPSISFFRSDSPAFGAPVELFDLISGLSGAAAYLLTRYGTAREVDQTVEEILRCFVGLASETNGLPAWHTPLHYTRSYDSMTGSFPQGFLNCGLAHGIPGPLAVMALGHRYGLPIEGLAEAIEHIATWLLEHRHDDAWGMNWPSGVGLDVTQSGVSVRAASATAPSHAGWCYGSPGLSRSLFLSGLALKSEKLCSAAVEAIEAVIRRPYEIRALRSSTFCHGIAGLLQVVLRFSKEAPRESLRAGVAELASTLLSMYDPQSAFGYQSYSSEGLMIDSPSLLDGAAGVSLVLLAIGFDVEPVWDRAFLLS
ncbi:MULTISPECIES: lanthionine synthetase C family protein [unclassified Bradyrhizobium]|uniref:lanthionine synthetase C family protein n=1 Tax=unclassified Bradyrhizobium TaxID=2631580 RepID=UPI001FF9599A|nr:MULTISPECIES: lanthionine synthetase C family protein [unclassified Bradyrhizobium]MCK1711148.1 lanthionine synthetase C family protein [Bradyrhizobium sp. 143]MCK1726844.1 lanthionine synthetase C family protein [Bradyrhizobium sp. 142]